MEEMQRVAPSLIPLEVEVEQEVLERMPPARRLLERVATVSNSTLLALTLGSREEEEEEFTAPALVDQTEAREPEGTAAVVLGQDPIGQIGRDPILEPILSVRWGCQEVVEVVVELVFPRQERDIAPRVGTEAQASSLFGTRVLPELPYLSPEPRGIPKSLCLGQLPLTQEEVRSVTTLCSIKNLVRARGLHSVMVFQHPRVPQ
jgi:hypothetical protein